jgi:hypothetical protein
MSLHQSGTALALKLAVAAAVMGGSPGVAHAASLSGGTSCQTVHVGPLQPSAARHLSYLDLKLAPGSVAREAVIVANPQRYSCKVRLMRAYGQTAINSGDTYPAAMPGHSCVEASCWLSRLPTTVVVPPHGRLTVPFTVAVPKHTRGGQYLAGVVAEPASPGPAPRRTHRRGPGFGASVVARVAIGVAVTVRGRLQPRLTIPAVRLDTRSSVPVLRIVVRDRGNTWEHPAGGAQIQFRGNVRSFGVRSSTVLPGDSATLPLPVEHVSRGSWPTLVELWYDHHRKRAVWRGELGYPAPHQAASVDGGSTPTVIASVLPLWAKLLFAALALTVALLVLLLLVLYRRRRRDDEESPADARA